MKDPIQELYNEHSVILSAAQLADKCGPLAASDPALYEQTMRQLLDFFRSYADAYHHHKEEDILFPEISRKNELLAEGVVQEMLGNHEDFRDMLKSVESFLDKKDFQHAQQQVQLYTEALMDHIAVENDELFVTAASLLSEQEQENMYFRFADCDRERGTEEKRMLEELVNKLTGLVARAG
jgi:hemerythrin-like domain-containing protein